MEPHASNIACLFICVWYLTLCILLHVHYCAHYRAHFESRERDQNFFVDVLCDGSLWHDNIKANERHLGCVFSVFSCPGLGCYLWEFINNHVRPRPVGGAGEDDFPQTFTSSLGLVTTAFENFDFSLDVKESMILLLILPGLLSVVYTMFGVTKEISMKVIQRSAPRMHSHEWHGM